MSLSIKSDRLTAVLTIGTCTRAAYGPIPHPNKVASINIASRKHRARCRKKRELTLHTNKSQSFTGAAGADFWLKGVRAFLRSIRTKHEACQMKSSAAPHIKKRARRISKNVVGRSRRMLSACRNPRKENPVAGCKSKEKMSCRFTISQNRYLQLR